MVKGFSAVAAQIQNLTVEQERSNILLNFANGQLGIVNEQLGVANQQLGVLRAIGQQTNALLGGVNQRLELLSAQQNTANVLLGNIAELMRLPDSQKQRQHHIEMGLKLFKNASKDPDLYADALEQFLAAEKLMPTDYFVLREIGLIYLYAGPQLDLEKAAHYLVRAGKYSSVDSEDGSPRLEFILAKSTAANFSSQQNKPSSEISAFASESYQHAAVAFYALSKFEESLKFTDKAIALNEKNATLRFYRSKYLAALGRDSDAFWELNKLKLLPGDSLLDIVANDLDLVIAVAGRLLECVNDPIYKLAEKEHRRNVEEQRRYAEEGRRYAEERRTMGDLPDKIRRFAKNCFEQNLNYQSTLKQVIIKFPLNSFEELEKLTREANG